MSVRLVWSPQPGPQKALVDCPFKLILFGGARGGGKTDGVLGKFGLKALRFGKAFNAVFFRREMPQADDLIERAKEIYLPLGGQWHEQKKTFALPGGGRIRFRPLENNDDAGKYMGQNVTDAAVEEAGNYPDPGPIDKLFGCLRSKAGTPVQLILTANPGGAGHHWLRHRFIDPSPQGMVPIVKTLPNGKIFRSVYIPSKVQNNQILLRNDPEYLDRLYLVGSPELVRAWLEGDWNVVTGAYFPEFGEKHIVRPVELPAHWTRFRSFDWGGASPFAVHWWAISDGEMAEFPKGAMVCYREWYGASAPNVGLKLQNHQIARGILGKEAPSESISYSVADPSIFKNDGGPCIAETFRDCGVLYRPADNQRQAGWAQLRDRLIGQDGRPMLYFFSTCKDAIRTLPALQHDERRPEDVDTTGDDHCGDSVRYACMSRPYVRPRMTKPARPLNEVTLDDLWRIQNSNNSKIGSLF